MTWAETLRSALDAVQAHRMRSLLTMLGIIIGISSVVLTVGFGQGAQDEVSDQIDALGSNLLIVSPGSSTTGGVRGGLGSASTLTATDAAALADRSVAPDVAAVAPTTSTSTTLKLGETNWTTSVVGTTTSWRSVRARSLSSGRFFTQAEVDAGADVVVLGPDAASELVASGNPVGETVNVDGAAMTVIGVLSSSGASSSGTSEDDVAVVPLSTAQRLSGGVDGSVSTIYVEAASQQSLGAAYQEVDALLANLHFLTASDTADFSIATQESLLETANSTNETLTVLLTGVAAISLLVGGIGVMNIMLVSVTERVREIGLRKALGATPSAVRRQFLVEASVLGLAGGVVGVAVGVTGALVLPDLIDQPVTISVTATLLAIVSAVGLGIGFGVYPAGRAARLTPIDALRSE